jgi:hypothetical protein
MTPLAIDRSWQSGNERADNLFFWRTFGFEEKDVLIENTDGIVKGTLFEIMNSLYENDVKVCNAILKLK